MKKTYCDRCGAEMVQNDYLMLKKNFGEVDSTGEFFDICPKCRESFFGWLNNKPAEQEKPAKQKPAKKMFPTWATIKQLTAIFCQSERHMNRLMARLKADRRKIKDGRNWWYEYKISENIYNYLYNKLGA